MLSEPGDNIDTQYQNIITAPEEVPLSLSQRRRKWNSTTFHQSKGKGTTDSKREQG